jgi:DeoR/GlpR family transcriptional regulator of sugar metabolism
MDNDMKKSRLAVERQKEIFNNISQVGTVYVANLSKKFNVTKETIRKDLEALEKEGLVQRTHGGAVLNHKMSIQRHMTNLDVKSSIAKEAAQLVEKGDIIALDSSDFSLQMAKELRDQEITVITNSIPITLELLNQDHIRLITIGGYVNQQFSSFVGAIAEKAIDTYHVGKFFLSCSGFDLEHGVFENHEMEAQIKQKFLKVADEVILMADHAQFGRKSLTSLVGLNQVDKLIVDHGLPIHNLTALRSAGINVVLAN